MLIVSSSVRSEAEAPQNEGWWSNQLLRFHSYGHLDRAYKLINDGRLEDARLQLRHYIELRPDDRDAQARYVAVCSALEDYQEVVRVADDLLLAEPDRYETRLQRATAREKLGRLGGAMDDYFTVANAPVAAQRDRTFALDTLAHLAVSTGNHILAEGALQLLSIRRPSYEVLLRYATVLQRLDRHSEAIPVYKDALRLAASNDQRRPVLLALGSSLAAQSQWHDAERYFLEAYAISPRDPDLLLQLAVTAFARKDLAETLHWSRERLALGDDPRAQKLLLEAMLEVGESSEIVGLLEQLAENSTNADERLRYTLLLAEHELTQGHFETAIEWAQHGQTLEPTTRGQRVLAFGLFRSGAYTRALPQLQSLLRTAQAPADRYELNMHIGRARLALGQYTLAAAAFRRAAASDISPAALLGQAEALAHSDSPAALVPVYRELLSRPDIPEQTKDDILAQLGYLYSSLGDHASAANAFQRVVDHRPEQWRIRLALAITLYQQRQWAQALPEFITVATRTDSTEALLYAGLCYTRLNKPGFAIYYFERARLYAQQLEPAVAIVLYDELGLAYAQTFEYQNAALALRSALALEFLPDRVLRLARVERLRGAGTESLALLDQLDDTTLGPDLREQYWDERARTLEAEQRFGEALAALTRAAELGDPPQLNFRLAVLYTKLNQPSKAIWHFEKMTQRDPANSQYAVTLGYAYLKTNRYADATQQFERALEQEPDHVTLHPQLGYLYEKLGRNEEAVAHFRQAIDSAAILHPDRHERDIALENWRQEVSKLNNRFDFALYHVFQESDAVPAPRAGLLGIGYAPSQGGMELTYQPRGIGFRDERVLKLMGRVLWQSESGSQRIDDDSTQGGIGLLYKPLREHNLYLSAEGRFKIGKNARNDALLRVLYSSSAGVRSVASSKDFVNYRIVYGDGAFALSGDHPASYFLEFRQGLTFSGAGALSASPYALAEAYGQTVSSDADNIVNLGLGVSLRRYFGRSHYESADSAFEINLQYKYAITEQTSGWAAGLVLRF